jgi:archaellum component FlaF (FlaF/FlaG flagellin family)
MTFATKDFDSHNAYASGTYTIPVSGKYDITGSLDITATDSIGSTQYISIYKNGAAVTENEIKVTYAGTYEQQSVVSDLLSCVAGDLITIRAKSSGTTASIVAGNTQNYFTISRQGN